MDNSEILATAEIRRQELAARLPRSTPAQSLSQLLAIPNRMLPVRPQSEQDAERRQAQINGVLSAALLPRRHLDADTSNSPIEWHNALNRILARLGRSSLLALIGPRGTGKTQIAVEAAKEAAQKLRSCRYMKAIEVFVRIKGAYRKDSDESEKEAIDSLCRPQFLILDEMSERGESVWEERMLRLIIDKRYDDKKDTLLIGNFNAQELSKSVGDSIASRIQETGGLIECTWPSFRSRK